MGIRLLRWVLGSSLAVVMASCGDKDGDEAAMAACAAAGSETACEAIRGASYFCAWVRSVVVTGDCETVDEPVCVAVAEQAGPPACVPIFAKHLETPTGFSACEAGLFGDQAYLFPDPPEPGAGSLRSMKITQWECQGLSCESAGGGDPTTGGGGSTTTCTDNPNWFEGNAGPTVLGQGVPEEGVVAFTLGGVDSEAQYGGVAVAYERLSDCPADSICPFALTDLRFALHDVTFGPVTLQAPKVFLNRPAFGAQVGDDVTIGHESLSLRIESSFLLFGQPFLDGAMIPLYVRNKGNVEMTLSDGVLEIHNARFDLFDGAVARLVIAATFCDEA